MVWGCGPRADMHRVYGVRDKTALIVFLIRSCTLLSGAAC